jgi:formylglycine-generating enzyme required for sulfatase activity
LPGDKSESSFECLNDISTKEDVLGFRPYVEAIAEFLTAEGTRPPITLSIEGQWGCGKSSFMKQLKEEIEKKNICSDGNKSSNQNETFDPYSFKSKIGSTLKYSSLKIKRRNYFTVWFNCWRYEKEDELWAAFALVLMEQLSEQLSLLRRLWAQFKLRCLRLEFKWKGKNSFYLNVVIFILMLCISIAYSIPAFMEVLSSHSIDGSLINVLVKLTGILGPILPILYIGKDIINVVGNPFDFSKFVSSPNYTEHISFIEHFHSDFDRIIESYVGNSRVYVFVDDLDRCEVPKAAELMQALNLMISDKANVYFSIGMDRKVISAGLAAKNEKVLGYLDVNNRLEYGYDFIEKFIQLPFKVPSPKTEDFKKFMNHQPEKKNSWLYDNPLSKKFKKLFSQFKFNPSNTQSDVGNIPPEDPESGKYGEKVSRNAANDEPEKEEKITNGMDCDEKLVELDHILEMVAPALDRNPRRMKQFINQFRFQRTIGKRVGLFSYNKDTDPENMWNCKKLAKFVAISMKWPSLILALSSKSKLLDQLQEYALKPKNETKSLEKWTKDEKLISLLRYGCEENNPLKKQDYTLSGLDFEKLLQISPEVISTEGENEISSITIDRIEFVRIPSGEFMMGSSKNEMKNYSDGTIHNVSIKYSFDLGKYPVNQKQWEKVMGSNPSDFKGDDLPVESVSWENVQEFIKRLNEIEGTDKYRLPSEAEWEYACRAGTATRYSFGEDESKLKDYAWYNENSDGRTHSVGQKKPNLWGLFDMHGNVWEWCQDRWHDNYNGAPLDGSAWEDGISSSRVIRGGCWTDNAWVCRSAIRGKSDSGTSESYVGFRLLRKL